MNSKSSSNYNNLKSLQSSYDNSIISKKTEDINISESNNLIEKNKNILKKLYSFNKEITPMNILEKIVNQKLKNSNFLNKDFYNIKIINEIICNENTHIVAEFKDFLIKGDYSEFLQKVYTMSECKRCLPKIFEYYDSCSVIFPNYVILPESKYIYKNIQRKQRIIDNQEDLENKKKKIQKGLIKESNDLEQFFTIQALDSILDQTDTSGIKKFFGVNQDDNSEKNISLENIINKITNAENNNNTKFMSERKFSNTTLKKNNDINKKRMGLNFNTINSKIKGRNYNRYLNGGGYNSLSNNNREKKNNNYTGLNVNSTTSNGMKNTKVSSTTIDIDSKNFIQNNNSINSNKKIINKNLNNSIKKPKIIQSLFTNNNKEYVIKIFKEVNKKVSNKLNNKKIHQRNIKSFSPINKSLNSKSKISNVVKKNKKLSPSSSSSTHNQISSYNSKKTVSNPKMGKIIDRIHHKKTLSYNAIMKDKNESSEKKIKDIPLTDRGFFNRNYQKSDLVLNIKKNKSPNTKNSTSPLINKKVNSNNINSNNNSNNINYNKKENKEKIQKNAIKNIKNIFNREIIYGTNINSHNNKSPDSKNNVRNINMLSLSPDNNILKSFNSFNSSNDDKKKTKKKGKNSVFPKNSIQGIQIKGFKYFT